MATATKREMETAARAMATATKRARARAERGMGTGTKRMMARAARVMAFVIHNIVDNAIAHVVAVAITFVSMQ